MHTQTTPDECGIMVLESCQDEKYDMFLMTAPDPMKGWTNKGRRRKVMETGQRKGNGKGKLGTGLLT